MIYRNYTFEDYYTKLQPAIDYQIFKFNNLKTESEDLKQEACILLFKNVEKLNEIEHYKKYFEVILKNHFSNLLVEEHKQGLWITDSVNANSNEEEFDILETFENNNAEYIFTDPWLDEYIEKRKQKQKEYNSRPEAIELRRKTQRKYESRPEVKKRRKEYLERPEVKERRKKYLKEYYSRTEVKEHRKEYYREYRKKEEVKEKKREYNKKYRERKKQEKLMNDK